jgi:membrane-associated phospholipid phosphatase
MVSLASWMALVVAFVLLAFLAIHHARFPGDLPVSRHVQRVHAPLFELALDGPEALAGTLGITIAAVLIVAVLCATRQQRRAFLVAAIPIGAALNAAIKRIVDRPRPSPNLIDVRQHLSDPSFPSGHATAGVLLFGLGWYLAGLFIRRRGLRLAAQTICVAAIVCTGIARIYDGVHWLSDVYAGIILGVLVLRAGLLVQDQLLSTRPSDPSSSVRREDSC